MLSLFVFLQKATFVLCCTVKISGFKNRLIRLCKIVILLGR